MALRRKDYFKLYEILNMLNGCFTPESTDFFDYCLGTLDCHHSFLRTRFCKRDEPLKDYEINPDINCVLCVFDKSFDASYLRVKGKPDLKMQIVFVYGRDLESEKELCKNLGFSYGYILNPYTSEVTNLGYMK